MDSLYGIRLVWENIDISQHWIVEKGIVDDVTMTSYTIGRNMPPSLMHIRNHYLIYWSFSGPKIGPISHIKVYKLWEIYKFFLKKRLYKSAIFSVKKWDNWDFR